MTKNTGAAQAARPASSVNDGYFRALAAYPREAKLVGLACMLAAMLSPQAMAATFPFIMTKAADDLGQTSARLLISFAVAVVGGALILPFAGWLVDRFGARVIAIPGLVLYGVLTAAIGLFGSGFAAFSALLVVATIFGYIGILAVIFKLVSEWFGPHEGLAYSVLINASTSVSGAILGPLTVALVNGIGWRNTYGVYGAVILLVVLPAAVKLLHEPPHVRAAIAVRSRSAQPPLPGLPLRAAVTSPVWIITLLSVAVSSAAVFTVRQNGVSLFGKRGYSENEVALALSVLLLASVAGQILCGAVLDRTRSPKVVSVFLAGLVIGLGLTVVASNALPILFISAALMGAASGAEVTFAPFAVGKYFGLRAFAQISGLGIAIASVAIGVVPAAVAGAAQTSGFDGPLVVLTIATAICAGLLLLLPTYQRFAKASSVKYPQPEPPEAAVQDVPA